MTEDISPGSDKNGGDDPSRTAPEDAAANRQKKLDAIKKAIDAGEYDSEEMMDRALKRFLDSSDSDS